MATLQRAIEIAIKAHLGQTGKGGEPYILHPLRVMGRCLTDREKTVAVLHDVVEDTEWTLEDLRIEGFGDDVLDAIDCLSRRDAESYEEFIDRIKPNPLAVKVKLADLLDNMDFSRLPQLTDKDWERLQRYHRAWKVLNSL